MNIIPFIPKQKRLSIIMVVFNVLIFFLIISLFILLLWFIYSISIYVLILFIVILIVYFFVISFKSSKGIIKVKKCLRDKSHPIYNWDRLELHKDVLVPWSVVFKSTFLGYCSSINSKNDELDLFFDQFDQGRFKTDEKIKKDIEKIEDILASQIDVDSEIYPTEEGRVFIVLGLNSYSVPGDFWQLYINKLTKKQERFKCVCSPQI